MILSEKELQNSLILLGAYVGITFHQEYTVEALPSSRPKASTTRRFDLVQKVGNEVRIIELKKEMVTLADVADIIGIRGYSKLARNNFPNEEVGVYLMSPLAVGIQEEALTLLEEISTYCAYVPIEELGRAMFELYISQLPTKGKWQAKRLYQEFKHIIGPYDLSAIEFK
jgi:hypothetical protein